MVIKVITLTHIINFINLHTLSKNSLIMTNCLHLAGLRWFSFGLARRCLYLHLESSSLVHYYNCFSFYVITSELLSDCGEIVF